MNAVSVALIALAAGIVTDSPVAQAATTQSVALGDGKVSSFAPQVGSLYSCMSQFGMGGAGRDGPWIQGSTFYPDLKLSVAGSVSWSPSYSATVSGGRRIINSNGLPDHPTGVFPIQVTDPAYQYDRNPNSIRAQTINLNLPANPTNAITPSCVPMGIIGIATTGAAIYNAVDGGGRDAVAHELQDRCGGHPEMTGEYHYHGPSPCFHDASGLAGQHSDLIGYALDGYGIYGQHGNYGELMQNSQLDACHGHTDMVMWDGQMVMMYHYHLTAEYPYSVGCFKGTVDPSLLRGPAGGPGGMMGGKGKGKGPGGFGGPGMNGPGMNGPSMNGPGMNGPGMNGPGMNGPGMNGPPPPFGINGGFAATGGFGPSGGFGGFGAQLNGFGPRMPPPPPQGFPSFGFNQGAFFASG